MLSTCLPNYTPGSRAGRRRRGEKTHEPFYSGDNEYFQALTSREKSQTVRSLCHFEEAPLITWLPLAVSADTCWEAVRRAAAAGIAPSFQRGQRPPPRAGSPACSRRATSARVCPSRPAPSSICQPLARQFIWGENKGSWRSCLCGRQGRGWGRKRAAAHRGNPPGLLSLHSGIINLRVKQLFVCPLSLPWAAFFPCY